LLTLLRIPAQGEFLMAQPNQLITVVVIDANATNPQPTCDSHVAQPKMVWRIARLSEDAAITLVAACSEDPADRTELLEFLPRYTVPFVQEELRHMQLKDSPSATPNWLRKQGQWVVIDLIRKRTISSPSMWLEGRNHVFDLFDENEPNQRWPLSIHLPPWWEQFDETEIDQLAQVRGNSKTMLRCNRQVLYEEPLLHFLAQRLLQAGLSPQWTRTTIDDRLLYQWTIEIHRDWLMTPREDLAGLMPRQLLHGAQDWLSRVLHGQLLRGREQLPVVALADATVRTNSAPMGRDEMVVYFDLCRELIDCGWLWIIQRLSAGTDLAADQIRSCAELIQYLRRIGNLWLKSPYDEEGVSAEYIIECCQRRVPRCPDITIQGMITQQPQMHPTHCGCTICEMLQGVNLEPMYGQLEGYQLEHDGEFAFSLIESHEDWLIERSHLGFDADDDQDDDDVMGTRLADQLDLTDEELIELDDV
jgi:hypothetical protein